MNRSQQLQGFPYLSLVLETSPDSVQGQIMPGPRTLAPGAFTREGPSSLVSDGILPSAIRCNGPPSRANWRTPLFPADRIWEKLWDIQAEFPNSVGPKGWTHEMGHPRRNSLFGTLAC